MEYMSYGTPGPSPARRYEPTRYSSTPVRPSGTGPRHLAAEPDPAPAPLPEHPQRQLGGSAHAGGRWPLVTVDLFFVAHDDWPHKLRMHLDVARLGLGAAVLAELLMAKYINISDGDLVPLVAGRPADPVAARLMLRVLDEPQTRTVRDWLAYLADDAQPDGDIYDQVGRRMVLAGLVRAQRTGLLRRSTRYTPVNISAAAWPWARISRHLEHGTQLGDADTVLGGLILATDLHSRVLSGKAGEVESRLRTNIAEAPAAVRELLRHTEAAVGSVVITGA
jgi:hypothetical protein